MQQSIAIKSVMQQHNKSNSLCKCNAELEGKLKRHVFLIFEQGMPAQVHYSLNFLRQVVPLSPLFFALLCLCMHFSILCSYRFFVKKTSIYKCKRISRLNVSSISCYNHIYQCTFYITISMLSSSG